MTNIFRQIHPVGIQRSFVRQVLVVAGAAAFMTTSAIVAAQETTETVTVATVETTATAEAPAAAESDLNIVLLGEKVGPEASAPTEGPFPDLAAATKLTFGGAVTDLTAPGLGMAQLPDLAKVKITGEPDVAIIFSGATDERLETTDEEQRAALRELVEALRAKNESVSIFLVPAATTVGAMASSNMRLAASELGAVFVPIGTEVAGQPYIDALKGVKVELENPDGEVETVESADEQPATAVTIQGGQIADPAQQDAGPEMSYEEKRASIQDELDRIAGQAGQMQALPDPDDTLSTTFVTSNTSGVENMTYPEGGSLRKTGPAARESINMKPLPAVKAFRPQIPVPRNEVNVKEPALSR